LVLAIRRSSALLIDLYIPREAPLSEDFERLPRLAASAAPAAICCFFDFAGIQKRFRLSNAKWICFNRAEFLPESEGGHIGQHDNDSDSGDGCRSMPSSALFWRVARDATME
jgi:hypothetical protein